jgi:hypothetical protein
MIFKAGLTESTLATVVFRSLTPKIELRIHGETITLRVSSVVKQKTTYESPALQNACLTWKSKSNFKVFDFECLDENSVSLAQFTANNSWSMTKVGRLEFFGTRANSGIVMDEIVVTGLALAKYTFMQSTAINTGAAVGAIA